MSSAKGPAFDLAARIAVGYADALGPSGVGDAARLAAVLEVMRS